MTVTRRNFLKTGLGIYFSAGQILEPYAQATTSINKQKIIITIELNGGNDGLNTVIPYSSGVYYQARPTLAIQPDQVLPLNGQIALHPALGSLHELFQSGKLAVVQAVGYPQPTRSHARSLAIWQTGYSDKIMKTNWLERYLSYCNPAPDLISNNDFPNRNINYLNNQALLPGGFSNNLKFIAESIHQGLNRSIYTVSLSGFDTHTHQTIQHGNLLKQLSDGLSAFYAYLQSRNLQNNVLILVFSEFGRRLAENTEGGTEHGTAGPVFVLGGAVRGGIYGDHPSLTKLDSSDLVHQVDFRSIYSTILEKWLSADSQEILGHNFDTLAFL